MQKSIKKAKNPDIEKLILSAMSEWGISERTIKEYLKIAIFNIESKTGNFTNVKNTKKQN